MPTALAGRKYGTMDKLFEYAILYNPLPTKKDEDEGKKPRGVLLKPITSVVAASQEEVQLIAAREIPVEYLDKLTQVVIAIRPF